ncbi:hypothetical protein RYX36_036701 [Vicia faba]
MDSVSDLLEIAGEDDSLLSGVNNSTSANLFSCSPLVSIRSRPLQTAQPVERIETTSVVSEDLTSSPKCSGPEASETQQSQQKKRKKKFGGFNLRKSLAWDRAFFTEQGVLNPTELSMISGTATPNSKSNLEVIDEEELATTSTVLQQIEENLFRHSSGGVSIRAKKIGAVSGLSPKPGASVKRTPPVASLGKRKVLATNNVGNKYKRSAIPKAVPSSSYPCHCLTDTAKTPSKESKITRISGPKSNVSANATTTRSGMLSSSSSKRNQNAHPGLSKNPAPSIPSLSKNPSPSIPRLSKNPTPSIPSLSKNPTPSIPSLSKNPTPSIPRLSKNPTYVPSIPKVDTADKCSVSRTLTKQAGKLLELSLSDVQSEAIMQIDNKQMAGVEVECDSSSFEIVSKQAEVENILDDVILKSQEQGELHENKIISSKENMALPTHGKEFLPKSQTHEQLEKEADHDLGNKLYDVSSNVDRSLYQEPQSMLNPIMQRTSNTVQNASGQDEGDQIKGPSGDVPTFKESLILQEEHRTSFKDGRHSGEFKGDNNVKSALLNSSLDDFSKTVPEGSKHGTPNLEAVSLQLQADQPKTLNPSCVKENGPEKENISNMNCSQHVHVMTLFSKGSPEKSILGINGASENESKIIEIKLPVNDQSGFIPRSPMDKECDQVIDSKAVHDRTPEFELDGLSEDCITVSTSSMADENNINEDSHLPGFQKPSDVVTVNSQDVHLDNDFLPAVIVSPTELKDQNLVEDAFEDCGFHSNEHNATNHHIEDMLLLASDNPTFIETIPQGNEVSSANSESFSEEAVTTVFENDKSPNAELDSSIEVSEDSCLLSEKSRLLASDNSAFIETIPQGNEVSSANSESFSDVAVTTVFENDKSPNTDMPSQTEDNIDFLEDNGKKIHLEIDASKTKQEVPIAKPPLNVAPFTEEWFAAIEAAGEAKLLNSDMLVNKDGNQDMDEKVELLGISGAEEGSLDISPSVDIKDMDEKVELLRINGADEGSLDISPSVEVQLENVISDEFDSSTEVSEDPCLLCENSKLLASENSIFNARIPQGSEVSSMKLNENAISAELDSSIEVNEGPCLLSEKSKLLASENSIFNARIPQGSEVSSMKLNENAISAELDSSIEVNEGPCLLSEKSKLLASENSIFNATIPQGSEVSSMILDENAISAELDSSIEVSEGPCLLSEKSKLLASENSIFNATIPQGSGVSSMKLNENAISAELDSYIEVSEGPCLLSENSKLLASEKSIFNATIPQGSKVSSMKLDENAISAELDSSIEVSEGPCLLSEKSKLLALENSIFNATIPQGSEVSSMKLNENAISAELDSSIEVTEGPFTSVVAWKPQEQCLLSQKPKILASDNPTFIETIPQGNEVSSENSESFSDVAVTTVFENDKSPNTDSLSQTNHNRKTIHLGSEIDATKTKQEVPIVAPPLNVAPFTEEWLAAIEAAGENILTMKSGAVQNSPPDKVQNEPNPWSPVKKNQEIGPFDCTKVTKHNLLSSDPS